MSALKSEVVEAVKAAMRAGDRERLATLRMMTAAIKQREVDSRAELDDAQVIAEFSRMVKQRREALEQYQQAGRDDLAERESAQIVIIEAFLPAALSESELDALIASAIEQTGAQSMRDMGQVMAQLKPKVQGRADMSEVSSRVRARLSG